MKLINEMTREEQAELLEKIKEELKNSLSEKRYEHSLGVMEKAMELAEMFGEDKLKAGFVGLTHDMAKEMKEEEMLKYIEENNLEFTKYDRQVPKLWHGIVAANMVKKYAFTKEMKDAIYYHTTGRENMTLLDKILYVADKSEERTRETEHAEEVRKITREQGLDSAILYVLEDWTIPKAISKGKLIHPNSIYARNDIISRMNLCQ